MARVGFGTLDGGRAGRIGGSRGYACSALWRRSLRFTLRTAEMTVPDAWVRPLAGGVRVLAFLNRGTAPATMWVSAATLGLTPASQYQMRDMWANTTTRSGSAFTRTVRRDTAILLRATAITLLPKPKPKPKTASKHG